MIESQIEAGIGDSVAVDGVCLTVADSQNGTLVFDVMVETLERAKLFGAEVNLEPRCGPATRSAGITSKVTSTVSAASAPSSSRAMASVSGSTPSLS